jgi:serine/threonine-protein kinase
VKDGRVDPPSRHGRRIDGDLETICLKCLEKEPARRYSSAEAVAEDLERWLAGGPIQARPIGRLERARRWCRRHAAAVALVATASLLVAAMVVGLLINSKSTASGGATVEALPFPACLRVTETSRPGNGR